VVHQNSEFLILIIDFNRDRMELELEIIVKQVYQLLQVAQEQLFQLVHKNLQSISFVISQLHQKYK
jgi:hypothetical protein